MAFGRALSGTPPARAEATRSSRVIAGSLSRTTTCLFRYVANWVSPSCSPSSTYPCSSRSRTMRAKSSLSGGGETPTTRRWSMFFRLFPTDSVVDAAFFHEFSQRFFAQLLVSPHKEDVGRLASLFRLGLRGTDSNDTRLQAPCNPMPPGFVSYARDGHCEVDRFSDFFRSRAHERKSSEPLGAGQRGAALGRKPSFTWTSALASPGQERSRQVS